MTKKLLNTTLPDKIIRRTSEILKDSSLTRYELITNIMVNEYGYEVIESGTDPYGFKFWKLLKKKPNQMNEDMDTEYIVSELKPKSQVLHDTFDRLINLIMNE